MRLRRLGYGAAIIAVVCVSAVADAGGGPSGTTGGGQGGTTAGAQRSSTKAVPARREHVVDATGTIVRLSSTAGWYVIVPDDDTSTRFAPASLPGRFKKDGLRVRFSGRVGEIAPDERLIGIPLEIEKIEAIECPGSR